jgi:hypothetical protein
MRSVQTVPDEREITAAPCASPPGWAAFLAQARNAPGADRPARLIPTETARGAASAD